MTQTRETASQAAERQEQVGPWDPPTGTGSVADAAEQQQASLFLALEAEAYDDRDYQSWLQMVEADFSYRVPVPVVYDDAFARAYDSSALLIDETKQSLEEMWFARLTGSLYDVAWGEHPPIRYKHVVTNVRARYLEAGSSDLVVRSHVILFMTRQSTATVDMAAERHDLLRKTQAGYRLAKRYSVLQDVILAGPALRVMW